MSNALLRMRVRSRLSLLALLTIGTPTLVSAQAISKAIGLFNVFVGVMLTTALLAYGIGFIVWIVRLGTWPSYRTEAIKIMEWSVVILFVLVVLFAIVQYFQNYPRTSAYIVATIILLIVIGGIIVIAAKNGGKEEKKEKKP